MRPGPECVSCILGVRVREITAAIGDGERGLEAAVYALGLVYRYFWKMDELTRIASRVYMDLVSRYPEIAGYQRRVRGESIRRALGSLSDFRRILAGFGGYDRFRAAARMSIAGNLLDTGVLGHEPGSSIDPGTVFDHPFSIDHTLPAYRLFSRGGLRVLWLFDNAGEAVYDLLFIEMLRGMGNTVIGVAKEDPGFQNDLTYGDAVEYGLDKWLDDLVSTGYPGSSIHLDMIGGELRRELEEASVIVAKGMAHYEYLSTIPVEEIGRPVIHMLVPKCGRVASSLGARKGSFVFLLRLPSNLAGDLASLLGMPPSEDEKG